MNAVPRRWWALGAIALSVLVVGLDLTVLTLALPRVSADLHASSSDLQWFVDSYSLVLAAALLPAGLLGDRYGRKRMMTGALVLFGVSSVACAYAGSAGMLIGTRSVLGLGAAVIMPLALAVIPVMFTEAERPRAIAVVGGAIFLGYPIGPILGGWLLDHFWWGSVFLINVPVVALAVTAVALFMPESRGEGRSRVDVTGVLLSSAGLTAIVYGVIRAGEDGWGNATAVAAMLAGAALVAAFAAWERRVTRHPRPGSQPLIDLSLFRSRGFTWGTILATLVSFALFGVMFAMPQYFQEVRGLDALGSGLRMLPMIGGMIVGLAAGQRLASPPRRKHRPAGGPPGAPVVGWKILVSAGFVIMAAALAMGALTTLRSGTGFAATWFAVTGFGLGLAMPTAMNAALGALSAERSGSGSALMTAMRQVGAAVGVAVLGTVLSSAYRGRLDLTGLPASAASAARSSVAAGLAVARELRSASFLDAVRVAFVHGMDVMLWACGGIAVAAAVLALAFLPSRPTGAAPAGPGDGEPDGVAQAKEHPASWAA